MSWFIPDTVFATYAAKHFILKICFKKNIQHKPHTSSLDQTRETITFRLHSSHSVPMPYMSVYSAPLMSVLDRWGDPNMKQEIDKDLTSVPWACLHGQLKSSWAHVYMCALIRRKLYLTGAAQFRDAPALLWLLQQPGGDPGPPGCQPLSILALGAALICIRQTWKLSQLSGQFPACPMQIGASCNLCRLGRELPSEPRQVSPVLHRLGSSTMCVGQRRGVSAWWTASCLPYANWVWFWSVCGR